jgi:hypothetical protein
MSKSIELLTETIGGLSREIGEVARAICMIEKDPDSRLYVTPHYPQTPSEPVRLDITVGPPYRAILKAGILEQLEQYLSYLYQLRKVEVDALHNHLELIPDTRVKVNMPDIKDKIYNVKRSDRCSDLMHNVESCPKCNKDFVG